MKLNFFARIYLAITDFRLYPFIVQKEKFITAFAYFLCFILLISAFLATGVTSEILDWTNEFTASYDSYISDFSIKDGVLDVEKNMDFDFLGVKVYTDDTKAYESGDLKENGLDEYQTVVYATQDSIVIGNPNLAVIFLKYADIQLNITSEELYNILKYSLDSIGFKLSLTGIVFCSVFFAYFITKFLNILGISIMLLFLGALFRTDYKFKDYMKIAFYVITLPIIIETIGIIVTGKITDYAYITYYLLIYVYMYYAIRALKLDNIIISTQEKILEMKNIKSEKDDSIFSKDESDKEDDKNQKENNEDNDDNNKSE